MRDLRSEPLHKRRSAGLPDVAPVIALLAPLVLPWARQWRVSG